MSSDDVRPWHTLFFHCEGAENVLIAAPYIKARALSQVLESIAPDAKLICVSRWTPRDIQYGTTDLACRSIVFSRGGEFLLHNRLHAKYYRFDRQVLIGSANLTTPGMNIGDSGNLEILCTIPAEFDTAGFEQSLLQEAYPVSDEEFALWELIQPIRQPQDGSQQEQTGAPEDWKPVTRRGEYLWQEYRDRSQEIPMAEQRKLAQWEVNLLCIPAGLTEPEFNNWVALSLLTSPFVKSILDARDQPRESIWHSLSQQWVMTLAEAEHSLSTAENWILYFGVRN